MRNNSLILYPFFVLFLYSCASQKVKNDDGTVKGLIGVFEGNCMPSPGVEPCKPKPISTTVYVTYASKEYQSKLLKDSIETNDKGEFMLKLPKGTYSLFIKDGNEIICDEYKCEKECFCTPFMIQTDSTTIINANIDHASW